MTGAPSAAILALMMFLAPALGAPTEEMLQDTLKSIVVSFAALAAALWFFLQLRKRPQPVAWHHVVFLPLALMAYALGSMAWSHTYLAGVEAIRWFIFCLIVWVGANVLTRERLPWIAWGVHAGAVVASLWTVLQFWTEFSFFPQGPHPASTFVNRNFFAEFAVTTLPFGALLLARARRSPVVALLAAGIGFVIVAIFMTGTRAALLALWLQVLVVLPLAAWKCREHLALRDWRPGLRAVAGVAFLVTVIGLGSIPSGDPRILDEGRGTTALERGFGRTATISPNDASLGVRMIMWRATMRVIEAHPIAGIGAGAWENEIPLYQAEGAQLETDYYAHNEFLQLVAEYGLVGWVFMLLLAAWLARCAWRTWRSEDARDDAPWRAVALTSLLALFVVSNVGFPWRMAATGALFALCLAIVASSEPRKWLDFPREAADYAAAAIVGCLALAAFITQRAAECESKIVRATKMALTISASGDFNNPRWAPVKREMLQLAREGIAINRHYRKITPLIADELAKWGDWKDATWVWESVLSSRPHVVAILCNAARGYASTGQPERAWQYLARAKQIQPRAPAVRSLEVVMLSREGKDDRALQMAREAIAQNVYDFDLLNAGFILGWRLGDHATALKAMDLRLRDFPESRAAGYIQLGTFYDKAQHDHAKALDAYRKGLAAATPMEAAALRAQIGPDYFSELGLPAAAQTSSSKR